MSHLRHEISALVDGRLQPEETEAALEHIVSCDECAELLAAERAFRRRLAQARDVNPSSDLTERLMELGTAPVPAAPSGARALAARAWEPLTSGAGRRRLAARSSVVLTGAAGVMAILAVVGAVQEQTGDPTTMLHEADGRSGTPLTLMATADAVNPDDQTDGTRAALAWLEENGWASPQDLPDDADINLVGAAGVDGEEVLVVEFVRNGHTATLLQQHGVLDVGDLAALDEVDVGDQQVHQMPGDVATMIMQCAETTVLVTSSDDPALARAIAGSMPTTQPGAGVGDRIDRGWETLVEWTDHLLQSQ